MAPAQGAAAVQDPCAASLTFFPANYEDSNTPAGWTQSVQSQAGNTRPDQLIKIALSGYPIPSLNIAPASVFTRVGGQMPALCAAGANAPGAAILAVPAQFAITWRMAGQGGTIGPYMKGDKTDPPANVTLGFVPQLPDVSAGTDAQHIAASLRSFHRHLQHTACPPFHPTPLPTCPHPPITLACVYTNV